MSSREELFLIWLEEKKGRDSGTYSSYKRALEIVSEKLFNVYEIADPNVIDFIIQLVVSRKELFYRESGNSYVDKGWIQAALGQYKQFVSGNREINNGADANSFEGPLQRILYGAPGTGKSFSIKSEIAKHQGIGVEKVDMEADNIFRTTFHPDYDYAQFVGCYKPTKTKPVEYVFVKDEVEYKTELDKINSGAEGEKVCKRINLAYCNLEIAEKYVDKIDKEKEKSSYSDTRNGINLAKLHAKTGATQTPSITYEFVPQVFTNALVKSYENSDESVYLVIEEINRGNCAQIFGDIFQLLDRNANGESEYAINVDEDLKKYLQDYFSGSEKIDKEYKRLIDDGKIKLPRNFSIIATMNTSDQSLFPMDSAFKRRWEWEYVPVDLSDEVDSSKFEITIDGSKYKWHDFLRAVNVKIKDVTKSEDKQMGNFFIKGDVDAKAFCNKVMFYLWNDISKDYYESNDSLFQTDKPVKDRKNNHFSFNELFGVDQTELLKGFMKFIGCDPVPNKPMESETNKEEDSSEN